MKLYKAHAIIPLLFLLAQVRKVGFAVLLHKVTVILVGKVWKIVFSALFKRLFSSFLDSSPP